MNIKLRNNFFIFALVLLCAFKVNAQSDVDSLLNLINNTTVDSVKSAAYYQLANRSYNNNPKKALAFVNKSSSYYARYGNSFQHRSAFLKAKIYRLIGNLDSSLHYIKLVYVNATKNNNQFNLNEAYSEYGLLSMSQGNVEKSIQYFQKQLSSAEKNKFLDRVHRIYNNLGTAYASKGDFKMAKKYFLKSLHHDQMNNNLVNLGNDYNNLGLVFIFSNQLDSANIYISKGLHYRIMVNDSIGIGGSFNNLALIENERGNYNSALALANSALKIAVAAHYTNLEVEIYDSFDQIYAKLGNFKMAYEYLKKKEQLSAVLEKEKFMNDIQKLESDIQLEQKEKELLEKDLKLEKSEKQKQKHFTVILFAIFIILALFAFLYNFFSTNKILKKQNRIILNQKQVIEDKHKDITDSITYAHRIQSSLIPSQQEVNKYYQKLAILFQPRDIVSGDFYWYTKIDRLNIFVLADCTGHGVPGAFMSFIGINQLNTIVNEKGITSPQQILQELKKGVVSSLNSNQSNSEKKDGMDVALVAFDEHELIFSGANQSILILRENLLIELKGNKQPIGLSENNENFMEEKFSLQKFDRIILYSDGVVDQFGGELGKKLKTRHFKAWLVETYFLPLNDQRTIIAEKLNLYKGTLEQTDDITLTIIEI